MPATVTIEAPSRLHFGMFAFGDGHRREFGGVGLMLSEPRLRITIRPAATFTCRGPHAERVTSIAGQVAAAWLEDRVPVCEIDVRTTPPEHSGLGLGTQLSLAVGAGLTRFSGLENPPSPEEIAVRLGRAARSSVGTHGFVHGGLIVDAGHLPGEPIGPLVHRAAFPADWRVVLGMPRTTEGLSGSLEMAAFAGLPPVPPETTGQLASELLLEMLPAIHTTDFTAFSASVYRFGRTAGACFAAIQGGPYDPGVAPLIERLRAWGVDGVGQSSWGPVIFAFVENESAAVKLRDRLIGELQLATSDVTIARADNAGAVVRVHHA